MKCKDSISGRVLVVLRSSFFVVREGYGFLRKPIFYSALRARASGLQLSGQWLFTGELYLYSRPYVNL